MSGGGLRFTSCGTGILGQGMLAFNGGWDCDSDTEKERVAIREATKYSLLLLPFFSRVRGTTDSCLDGREG